MEPLDRLHDFRNACLGRKCLNLIGTDHKERSQGAEFVRSEVASNLPWQRLGLSLYPPTSWRQFCIHKAILSLPCGFLNLLKGNILASQFPQNALHGLWFDSPGGDPDELGSH